MAHHGRFGRQPLKKSLRANDLQCIVVLLVLAVDQMTAARIRQSWGGEAEGAVMFKAAAPRLPDADNFLHHVRPDEQDNLITLLVGFGETLRPRIDINLR
eukprot:1543846-Prymnesium_polylepis.1